MTTWTEPARARRVIAAVVAVLVLAALTACDSSTEDPDESPTGPPVAADFAETALTDTPTSAGGKDLDQASLVTPHFGITQDQVLVGTSVPETQAAGLDLNDGKALSAKKGYELVVATFRNVNRGAYAKDASATPPTLAVLVGDTVTPVAALPAGPDAYLVVAVSVPTGKPVLLQVTDSGQTVSWDLRQGVYADDPVSQASAQLTTDTTQEDVGGSATSTGQVLIPSYLPGYYPDETGPVDVTLSTDGASFFLTPFIPGAGWAAAGTRWAVLSGFTVAYSTDLSASQLSTTEGNAAYSLTAPDGTAIPLSAGNVGSTLLEYDLDGDYVVFAVPTAFTVGTFVFSPQAPLQGLSLGRIVTVAWTQVPVPLSVPVDSSL